MRTTLFFQKRVGWSIQMWCTVLPVIAAMILTFLILSPPTFPALALYRITGSVNVPSTNTILEAFNFTSYGNGSRDVRFEILLGAGGGCMKYDDEASMCQRTLHFCPSSTYLHLPPDETPTARFPNMNWMAFLPVALAFLAFGIIAFCLGPFIPGCYFVSAGILWFLSFYSIPFIMMGISFGLLSFDVDLRGLGEDTSTYTEIVPKVQGDWTGACVFPFIIPIMVLCSTAIISHLASKIKETDPPAESRDVEMQIPVRAEGQPTAGKVDM